MRRRLDNQGLSGTIPTGLTTFSRLAVLSLSDNNFTGTVPSVLSTLPSLVSLCGRRAPKLSSNRAALCLTLAGPARPRLQLAAEQFVLVVRPGPLPLVGQTQSQRSELQREFVFVHSDLPAQWPVQLDRNVHATTPAVPVAVTTPAIPVAATTPAIPVAA